MKQTSFLQQNTVKKPSFLPKYSDADIFRNVLSSSIWKDLFLQKREAAFIFVKAMLLLKIEMFALPIRAVLHFNIGYRSTGLITTIMSTLMVCAFNTLHLVGYLATFFPFVAPIIPFLMSPSQLYQAVFIDIRSVYLLAFVAIFLIANLGHLAWIFLNKNKDVFPSSRGTSWLHLLIFDRLNVNESWVTIIVEPVLIGSIGYGILSIDFTFGLYLLISSICLFAQEFYDGISKKVITP